jgi:hypothetical protein
LNSSFIQRIVYKLLELFRFIHNRELMHNGCSIPFKRKILRRNCAVLQREVCATGEYEFGTIEFAFHKVLPIENNWFDPECLIDNRLKLSGLSSYPPPTANKGKQEDKQPGRNWYWWKRGKPRNCSSRKSEDDACQQIRGNVFPLASEIVVHKMPNV